jgi:hypothetical protein
MIAIPRFRYLGLGIDDQGQAGCIGRASQRGFGGNRWTVRLTKPPVLQAQALDDVQVGMAEWISNPHRAIAQDSQQSFGKIRGVCPG